MNSLYSSDTSADWRGQFDVDRFIVKQACHRTHRASPLMTGGAMDGEVRTKACTTPADYISRRAFSRMDGRASYSDRTGATVLGHEGAA